MVHRNIMVIGLLSLVLAFGSVSAANAIMNEYFNIPWIRENKNTFQPDWSLLPSVQKTKKLFSDFHVELPSVVQEREQDCSVLFEKDGVKVTLFANGVMKSEREGVGVEYYDVVSTLKCSLSLDGKLTSAHVDKKLQHVCAVAIEEGNVLCKSIQKSSGAQQRLNCQIRLQDGFSTTFSYAEDGTIVAKESTGMIEVLPTFHFAVESIMKSHGMIELPKKAVCTLVGVLCQDGEGLTCYALDGIFMRISQQGMFNVNIPTQAVRLEGFLGDGDVTSAWKKTVDLEREVFSARLDGVDILFNNSSGEACLSVNPTTFEIGEFMYDNQGHYCRRNGTGCLRYGFVSPLLTYGGVCALQSKSPQKENTPSRNVFYHKHGSAVA